MRGARTILPARRSTRVLLVLLIAALPGILVLPFVPLERFVERYDDAFYYFQVADQYARTGRWTFDGVEPTNGVQPLWGGVLSGLAVALHASGTTDKLTLARVFTLTACLLHAGSALVLFGLVRRLVSPLAGVAAAGALLCSPGQVWARAAGMESSLYALLLVCLAVAIGARGWDSRSPGGWFRIGLLLGLTTLARLNAALLLPWIVARLWRGLPPARRAGALAPLVLSWAAVVAPYGAWNLATTGLLLPVSGAAKQVEQGEVIRRRAGGSRLLYAARQAPRLHALVAARSADGLWLVGGRVWLGDGVRSLRREVGPTLALLLALAMARGGLGTVVRGLGRLLPLWYLAGFAATNAVVSVVTYPTQVEYAMTGWWLVELDLVLCTGVATLVALCLEALWGGAWAGRRSVVAMAWVLLLAGLGSAQALAYHARPAASRHFDWNETDNAGRLAAARWLAANTQPGDVVGAWNAGVVAYFSDRVVVNLDGLVNSPRYLAILRQGRTAEYLVARHVRYLSDNDPMFEGVKRQLGLSEQWRWYSTQLGAYHRIYRVEPPSAASPGTGPEAAPPDSERAGR